MQNLKVALVTGASRGIGASIAWELARNGYRVVINYKNSSKAAIEQAQAIHTELNIEALPVQADVAIYGEVEAMVHEVHQKFGNIDLLVNNAGIVRDALLQNMTETDWDEVINTNLKGVFNCSKAVLKTMQLQRQGRIINISSIVGQRGNKGQVNYAAAKAGMIAFSKSLALELSPWQITVNVVVPGFTETDMTQHLPAKARARILQQIPLARPCNPKDVAQMVSYLASDAAVYISGQVFNVDNRVL